MVSNIDKTKPVTGIDQPAQVIRDNFIIANIEITELQARKFDSDGSSRMTGPLGLVFFTLAGLPPAIDNEGSLVYVTDSSPPSPFYSDGLIWRAVGSGALVDIVDDTTPQLGGDLDVNGFSIISVSDGDILITPDGTGTVILDGLSWPFADGTNGQVLTTDGAGNLSFTTIISGGLFNVVEDTTPQLGGELDAQNNKIINLATPTADADAATKLYVDSVASGLDPKESVRVATTADLGFTFADNGGVGDTLTAGAPGTTAIDTITLADGDRVLVKDESDAKQNGIYVASDTDGGSATILTRATDQDGSPSNEVSAGNFTFVETGAINASTGWVVIGDGVLTINVDDVDWAQFSDVSGGGLDNVVEDLTPQLGGNLDANNFSITTTGEVVLSFASGGETGVNNVEVVNGITGFSPIIRSVGADSDVDMTIEPKGNGIVILGITGDSEIRADINSNLTIGGGDSDSFDTGGNTTIISGDGTGAQASGDILITPGTGGGGDGDLILNSLTWPIADGTVGQALITDGFGTLSFSTVGAGSLSNIVEDTTPQLGGSLDVNGNSIVSTSNGDIAITPNGSGSVVLDGLNWPQADGSNGQVLTTDGGGNLSFSAGGGGGSAFTTQIATSTPIAASDDDEILVDTSSLAITVNLPGSPTLGDRVRIIDGAGNASSFNITVGRNGEVIMGIAADFVINVDNAGGEFVYMNVANGWRVVNNV